MGCGSTGSALDRAADWSVLTREDELWLAGVGCTAARLDFLRGSPSPPAAIATALAEGLQRRLERFGGIMKLQKNSEKRNTRYYPKHCYNNENKKMNRKPVMGKTKSGKESLSDKRSTQQLPSYAKINRNRQIDNSHKAKLYRPTVDESTQQQWTQVS